MIRRRRPGGRLAVRRLAVHLARYEAGQGGYTAENYSDPLVRSLRLSGQPFEDGLILTLYGKVMRWGPGWWIDHPSPSQTPEQQAIARQFRQIRVAPATKIQGHIPELC